MNLKENYTKEKLEKIMKTYFNEVRYVRKFRNNFKIYFQKNKRTWKMSRETNIKGRSKNVTFRKLM